MLAMRPIDMERDWEMLASFHRDLFEISFGSTQEFSAERYRSLLADRLARWPEGQRLAIAGDEVAGQVELLMRAYEGRTVGFTSVLYLTPPYRGRGLGEELLRYAYHVFLRYGVDECHLHVTERNARALSFYERHGFARIAPPETERGSWRMALCLAASEQ